MLVGRRRERPRCAATARRIRSATAPEPIAAVQNFRTYGCCVGNPGGRSVHTAGSTVIRRVAVGREAPTGETATPGGGARTPERVGGRALSRGTAPGAAVAVNDMPNTYQIASMNVKSHG